MTDDNLTTVTYMIALVALIAWFALILTGQYETPWEQITFTIGVSTGWYSMGRRSGRKAATRVRN